MDSVPPPLPPPAPPPVDETVCGVCGAPELKTETSLRLCESCHGQLVARPLPIWIKLCAAGVIAAMAMSLVNFPETLRAASRAEKAKGEESRREYAAAFADFRALADKYPDSQEMTIRTAVTAFAAGERGEALTYLNHLSGRELDKDTLAQANALIHQMGLDEKPRAARARGESGTPRSVRRGDETGTPASRP